MKIRKSRMSDFDEVYKIMNEEPNLQSGIGNETYDNRYVSAVVSNKGVNYCLVLEDDDGKIVGFLVAEIMKYKGYAYVDDMYVAEEHRREGWGEKLLKKFEAYCKRRGIWRSMLLTLPSNKRMRKFLKKRGYEKGNLFYFYEKGLG